MKIKIDPLDTLFSRYIRTLAGWRCERCGKQYQAPTSALHCSHFWGRKNMATRWEPENCCALCHGCHSHFTANPELHREFFRKRLGQKRYDALMIKANTLQAKPDKEMIKLWLKKKMDEFPTY